MANPKERSWFSRGWFQSIALWVMGPVRFHGITLLPVWFYLLRPTCKSNPVAQAQEASALFIRQLGQAPAFLLFQVKFIIILNSELTLKCDISVNCFLFAQDFNFTSESRFQKLVNTFLCNQFTAEVIAHLLLHLSFHRSVDLKIHFSVLIIIA